jgi:hypothetical protein
MTKVLIELEALRTLTNVAETFVEGSGDQEEAIHDAIFLAEVAIGAHDLPEAA